ncbi:hypothetical protein [Stenoxybacter acetivorans]|uniref:hypothetical protein n=1 Tax=Stenoxybacter acetivorans TaxID=422441 RepID=UPI001B7FFC10|nr:hypothetical protein [Stenoxybacter acetivorans]
MKRNKRVEWHRPDTFAPDVQDKQIAIVGGTDNLNTEKSYKAMPPSGIRTPRSSV